MKKKSKVNKTIYNNTFSQIGNLMFYGGWNVDYVYFKTLLRANEYFPTGIGPRQYNPELAGPIAAAAIGDAQSHKNFNNLTQEESIDHFSDRFKDILNFLKQAYKYELKNETAFFTNKYNQLIKTFSEEEQKQIPEIQECLELIKNGQNGTDFDYKKFDSLINILMQGYENSKTIAKYESKRLNELDDAVKDILKKKEFQLKGLAYKNQWKNAEERITKHYKKFQRNITVSYVNSGSMTSKQDDRYEIRGAFRFAKFQQSNQVADRKLAQWAERMISQLITNKTVITKLATVIMRSYPINGDFTHLTEKVRGIIIQGVIEYGRQNLKKVLTGRFNQNDLEQFADRLIASNVFDTVKEFKIEGLPTTFGQTVKEANLLKQVQQISDMSNKERNGEKLYMLVRDLFAKEASFVEAGEESYLIQAMKHNKKSSGQTAYEDADKLISLIKEIIQITEKIEEDNKKILKANEEYQKEYEIEGKYGESASIQVEIKNGKASVNIDNVNQMLVEEGIFKKSQSKDLISLVNTLMAQTSQRLKKDIIASLSKAYNDKIFQNNLSESDLLNEVAGELRQISIRINGPTLSELVEAWLASAQLGSHGKVYHTGQLNNKNDNVIIEIESTAQMQKIQDLLIKRFGSESEQVNELNSLYDILNQAKLNLNLKIAEEGQKALTVSVKNYDPKKGPTTSERYLTAAKFSYNNVMTLAKENEEINKLWGQVQIAALKLKKYLKQYISEDNANTVASRAIKDMSNSFQISTTVKTYNTYNSQIGFIGGSLGKNLDVQLDNLASIFQSAGLGGMIEKDLQWLRSAILNCSPKTIAGETNKGLIENYLSAAAAFALFDEGGQENMIISDTYKDFFQGFHTQSSTQILHLYRVNSMIVPGSQVLLRTINTLETEVIPQINNIPEVMNKGAGIMIINNIDDSRIPNRPISKPPTNTDPWETVGEQAAGKIQLKILFLAGLMDIVNHINGELNKVELPQ